MKRTVLNEMQISFVSKSENESFARQAVCSFISTFDPTIEELSDIRIIVSEAVTNCIIHAYKDRLGIISINVKYFSDDSVRIQIKDKGVGIEDIEKCMEPLYTTCPDEDRCGMGFSIMQSFSDQIRVLSKPQKGTKIVLIRKLSASVKTTEKDPT